MTMASQQLQTTDADRIRKVVVLGGQGRMGRLFVNLCLEAGHQVAGFDVGADPQELAEAVAQSQLVLLAVPIGAMEQALATITPHMRPEDPAAGPILVDIASVKLQPMDAMLRAYAGPVVGTHPLFGPQPQERPLRVAVCQGRETAGRSAQDAVQAFLLDLGMAPFCCTAQEHDRAMAFVQGLNFVTHVSYLSALADLPGIERFITPSFQRRLTSAEKMLTEDADLFEALFESNPYSQEAVRLFRGHLSVAAGGDVNLLAERASWWWRSHHIT